MQMLSFVADKNKWAEHVSESARNMYIASKDEKQSSVERNMNSVTRQFRSFQHSCPSNVLCAALVPIYIKT